MEVNFNEIRSQSLVHALISGQRCDNRTFDGKLYLEAAFNEQIGLAIMYGVGAEKLAKMLENISITTKEGKEIKLSFSNIWMIIPIPKGGISKSDMEKVDIVEGDEIVEGTDKPLKETIREIYNCKTDEETEYYLKRYLAT